ncbi:MAG: dephospho-CoA kinase [Propionibacteriaceae bacterium]|jgi:dephospho-CoA kinase|nr:dephospho-CoA kinase [Propionibacteriaceae bacterium]
MIRIGLTGGIASGKSVVAGFLSGLGAAVIDADDLARAAVAVGTPGLAQVVELFGPQYLLDDGSLDRAALGELVFNDAAARARLEAVIHPEVRRLAEEAEAKLAADSIVVQVIPLLLETGQTGDFDAVVLVDADPAVQLARLMARSGLSQASAQSRIDAQATRSERLAAADYVISNDSDLAALQARTACVLAAIKRSG